MRKDYNRSMKTNPAPELFNGLTYVLAVAQTNEIFQIIELVCSILTSCVLIGFRLWKWYKEAKKDGEITRDEIAEAIDILQQKDEDKKKGE